MTEEVKNEGRKGWLSKRSRSTVGGSTALEKQKQELEPKHLLKTKSGKDKRWFRKKSQAKEGSNGPQLSKNAEDTDLEPAEGKSGERLVQGFYRDDDGGPSPAILQTTVSAARDAVKEFSKDFVSQLTGKPDLAAALEAKMRQELNAAPAAATDLKFLTQAYTVFHLFSGFENASFGINSPGEKPWEVEQHMATCFEQFQKSRNKVETISKILENKAGDSFLSEFCTRKFKSLVPVDVESALFGEDCEHHSDLLDQKHPETAFYKSFLSAAVSVWLLQRLRFSFEQKVVTIAPTGGDAFQRRFMLPAVPGIGDNDDESDEGLEVLYTVFPGFRVGESIVKSLVYIVEKPTTVETSTEQSSSNVEALLWEEFNPFNPATADRAASSGNKLQHTEATDATAEQKAATDAEQTVSTASHVATEEQTAFTAATEEEIASTVKNAAVQPAPESKPTYVESVPFSVTPSTRKESSEIKKVDKSLSSKETPDAKGAKRNLLQKIRHKVFHKKTSKKIKAAENSPAPAVSPSVETEPQRIPTSSTEVEPASTLTATIPREGEQSANQSTPAATVSEPAAQDTTAGAAATTSLQGEISPFEEAPSEPAHQSTPLPPATTFVHEISPFEEAPSSESTHPVAAAATTPVQEISAIEAPSFVLSHDDTPAAAHTSVQGEIHSVDGSLSSENTPAAATTPVQGEISPLEEAPSSQPVQGEISPLEEAPSSQPVQGEISPLEEAPSSQPVQGEISPLEEAPSSQPAPPAPTSEIEVSGSPSSKGPPLKTLD